MSPDTAAVIGMAAVVAIDRLPELARIIAADRKDKRAKAAAKDGAQ